MMQARSACLARPSWRVGPSRKPSHTTVPLAAAQAAHVVGAVTVAALAAMAATATGVIEATGAIKDNH